MGKNSEVITLSKSMMQKETSKFNKDRIRIELVHAYLMDRSKHRETRNILKKVETCNLNDINGIRLYYYAAKSLEDNMNRRIEYIDMLIDSYENSGQAISDCAKILNLRAEKLGVELPLLDINEAKKKYDILLKEVQDKSGKNSLLALGIESKYYYGFYYQVAFRTAVENNSTKEILEEVEKIKGRLEEIQKENPYVMDSNYVFYIRYTLSYLLVGLGKFKSANEYIQQNYELIKKNDALISEKKLLDDLYRKLIEMADAMGLHSQRHLIIKK